MCAFEGPPKIVRLHGRSDTCGYAVPVMAYVGERDLLTQSHSRRDESDLAAYGEANNRTSIDGLPALAAQPAVTAQPAVAR
jgi:hypothetical protein